MSGHGEPLDASEPGIERYDVCGVPIAAASMEQVMKELARARWGRHRSIHFCNTYTLSLVESDPLLVESLRGATLNLPDGWPVALVGRWRRIRGHAGSVPGPDTFECALSQPGVRERRHFMFGSTPEVIAQLERVLAVKYPSANIVGAVSPTFGGLKALAADDALDPIVAAKPDVVWVGLGTPLQDQFIGATAERLPATFVAVGAAFDFAISSPRRAPTWVRKLGMEWAWRLGLEPRRLWRRYLIGTVRFVRINWSSHRRIASNGG